MSARFYCVEYASACICIWVCYKHLDQVMVNGIRTSEQRRLNKGRGSKFCVGSGVRKNTPEERQRTLRPKRCEYNNKAEDDSSKTLNDPIEMLQNFKHLVSVEFLKVFVQKTTRQYYYSSTSPRFLTPYTEGRWSKYYSATAYPKKPSEL